MGLWQRLFAVNKNWQSRHELELRSLKIIEVKSVLEVKNPLCKNSLPAIFSFFTTVRRFLKSDWLNESFKNRLEPNLALSQFFKEN